MPKWETVTRWTEIKLCIKITMARLQSDIYWFLVNSLNRSILSHPLPPRLSIQQSIKRGKKKINYFFNWPNGYICILIMKFKLVLEIKAYTTHSNIKQQLKWNQTFKWSLISVFENKIKIENKQSSFRQIYYYTKRLKKKNSTRWNGNGNNSSV